MSSHLFNQDIKFEDTSAFQPNLKSSVSPRKRNSGFYESQADPLFGSVHGGNFDFSSGSTLFGSQNQAPLHNKGGSLF